MPKHKSTKARTTRAILDTYIATTEAMCSVKYYAFAKIGSMQRKGRKCAEGKLKSICMLRNASYFNEKL